MRKYFQSNIFHCNTFANLQDYTESFCVITQILLYMGKDNKFHYFKEIQISLLPLLLLLDVCFASEFPKNHLLHSLSAKTWVVGFFQQYQTVFQNIYKGKPSVILSFQIKQNNVSKQRIKIMITIFLVFRSCRKKKKKKIMIKFQFF